MRGRLANPLLWLLLTLPGIGRAELTYVPDLPHSLSHNQLLVDTRPREECLAASLTDARCLPLEDFFGPQHRLASFRDIAWVLGTAGIRGNETVLVVGDKAQRRDAVAALLHLAGQAEVQVVTAPLGPRVNATDQQRTPGRVRGLVRSPIFVAQAREQQWLLRDELREVLTRIGAPRLLDGRPAPAYWGEWIRGRRGGHLPGAESLPAAELRTGLTRAERPSPGQAPVIAYAHDPVTGLAYLTLLRAGLGLDARLYAGGWREWGSDLRLPADAVSYPDAAQRTQGVVPAPATMPTTVRLILTLLAALCAVGFGFILGRRNT